MNTTSTPVTSNKRQEFAAALALRVLPQDATDEEMDRLLEKIDEVAAPSAAAALKIARPPPQPAVTVVAEFMLGGRKFKAVLTHQAGEELVLGEESIRRADTEGKAVRTETDWQFVYEHRHELPPELNDYWLATARPLPDDPRNVSGLYRHDGKWYAYWFLLDYHWNRHGLVLVVA